ncbi:MAG: ATP-binding protein, partial [Chloroflexi bacterium]|nr:ATP-binding protein [Chloroflexota bacterium]
MKRSVHLLRSPLILVGVAGMAHILGCPDPLAAVLGIVAAIAGWRAPPRPDTTSQADLISQTASAPGLKLGTTVSVPPQAGLLAPGQPFWLELDELARHALVTGSSGSGKTTTISRLMDAALGADWSVAVVDAKGGQLLHICRQLGERHSRPARIWLPGWANSWTYDPCDGEPAAIGNRLVGAFTHGPNGQVYRNLS